MFRLMSLHRNEGVSRNLCAFVFGRSLTPTVVACLVGGRLVVCLEHWAADDYVLIAAQRGKQGKTVLYLSGLWGVRKPLTSGERGREREREKGKERGEERESRGEREGERERGKEREREKERCRPPLDPSLSLPPPLPLSTSVCLHHQER